MRRRVIKTDGSVEEYLHTKVIGTITKALECIEQTDICVAEHLAEAVTYFLYEKNKPRAVESSEILALVKAVLTATGYEDAAAALSEHHFERKLKRSRTEVVPIDIQHLSDARALCNPEQSAETSRWDKSRIVQDVVQKHGLSRHVARTVASMVEEKIFRMGINRVPASLIKQLVFRDVAAALRAEQQLQPV